MARRRLGRNQVGVPQDGLVPPRPGPGLRSFGLRVTVLALLVAVAVALRAISPLRASGSSWRVTDLRSVPQAVVVVLVLVGGPVVLVLALLSDRGDAAGGRRPKRRSTLASLALVAGVVVGLALLSRLLPHPAAAPTGTSAAPVGPATGGAHGAVQHTSLLLLVGLAALAVAAAALAARRRPSPLTAEPPAAPAPVTALTDGLAAAAQVLRERRTDPPRQRVVAAYAGFERAMAAHGLSRGPSGTPNGLLARAVELGAPSGPAGELTELFGAARFGVAVVTEGDVARAERALAELLATR